MSDYEIVEVRLLFPKSLPPRVGSRTWLVTYLVGGDPCTRHIWAEDELGAVMGIRKEMGLNP